MHDLTQENIVNNWSTNSPPLVSIVCHTYNHEKYIQEAIDSFLMQETSFPFEIIIHDDASTDNTTTIIEDYAERFPLIIKLIIQKDNQFSKGLKPALFSFKHAKAKYIALCEGDDYWTDSHKLHKQVSFLETNSEYVITYHDCTPFDENGPVKINYGGARRDLDAVDLQKSTPIFTLTTCFRNLIKELPPEHRMAKFGDLVIWSLLGAHGKGKYMGDIQPAMYRVHDGGAFSKKTKVYKIEMQLVTRCALFLYHSRQGNKLVADHFKGKMQVSLLQSLGALKIFAAFKDALIREIRRKTARK